MDRPPVSPQVDQVRETSATRVRSMAFWSCDRGTILGCGEVLSVWWTFVDYNTDAIPLANETG